MCLATTIVNRPVETCDDVLFALDVHVVLLAIYVYTRPPTRSLHLRCCDDGGAACTSTFNSC